MTGHSHHRAHCAVTPVSGTLDVRSQWATVHIMPLDLQGMTLRFPSEFSPRGLGASFYGILQKLVSLETCCRGHWKVGVGAMGGKRSQSTGIVSPWLASFVSPGS